MCVYVRFVKFRHGIYVCVCLLCDLKAGVIYECVRLMFGLKTWDICLFMSDV